MSFFFISYTSLLTKHFNVEHVETRVLNFIFGPLNVAKIMYKCENVCKICTISNVDISFFRNIRYTILPCYYFVFFTHDIIISCIHGLNRYVLHRCIECRLNRRYIFLLRPGLNIGTYTFFLLVQTWDSILAHITLLLTYSAILNGCGGHGTSRGFFPSQERDRGSFRLLFPFFHVVIRVIH